MEARKISTVGQMNLKRAAEAWGIERVEDVADRLREEGYDYLVVQDGGDGARLFDADAVFSGDPDAMLDLLEGGVEVLYVDANTPEGELPRERPLAVRDGAELLGVLMGEKKVLLDPAEQRRKARAWALPSGGADAQAAAMDAIRGAMPTFRKKRVALVLDVQPSRVEGDGFLVRDIIDMLLEESLEILQRCGGGTGVHVTVGQGPSGLWIGVEDHGSRNAFADIESIMHDGPSEDPTVLALRRLARRVEGDGGVMRVQNTRSGTRFMVRLPTPGADA